MKRCLPIRNYRAKGKELGCSYVWVWKMTQRFKQDTKQLQAMVYRRGVLAIQHLRQEQAISEALRAGGGLRQWGVAAKGRGSCRGSLS
jgi:hypothetical protein